jgi:hypothetical protein
MFLTSEEIELGIAIGYFTAETDESHAHAMQWYVENDPVVMARRKAIADASKYPVVLTHEGFVQALRELPKHERDALRVRVLSQCRASQKV